MSFEWRVNNNDDFNPAEGGLFVCQSSRLSNPTLLSAPLEEKTSSPEATSADPLIRPCAGDDLSPPNAVDARKMNGIAIPVSTSAGWSTSPPKQQGVYPSEITYDLSVKTSSSSTTDSLEMNVALEYTNPHYEDGESMMVKVAIAKTLVQAGEELALVATQFQEYVSPDWVDITADVDYTKTADAVVDAVLKDPNVGQTAGKATVTAETIELTLGPFSAKARLILSFQAEKLYTYDAMSIKKDASDIGSCRLLPLWVTLPFAPVDNEAGLTKFSVRLQAPPGASVMPLDQFTAAYHHLKKQDSMRDTTILAVSELVPQHQTSATMEPETTLKT